jgi:hypothetical protein
MKSWNFIQFCGVCLSPLLGGLLGHYSHDSEARSRVLHLDGQHFA